MGTARSTGQQGSVHHRLWFCGLPSEGQKAGDRLQVSLYWSAEQGWQGDSEIQVV